MYFYHSNCTDLNKLTEIKSVNTIMAACGFIKHTANNYTKVITHLLDRNV